MFLYHGIGIVFSIVKLGIEKENFLHKMIYLFVILCVSV